MQIKLIFTRKVLASFWKRGFLELGSGLFKYRSVNQDTIVNVSRISCQNESEKIKFFAVNNGSRLRAFIVAMNDDYVFYTGLTSAGANGYIHIRLQRPFQTLELASNRGLRKSVQLMEKENWYNWWFFDSNSSSISLVGVSGLWTLSLPECLMEFCKVTLTFEYRKPMMWPFKWKLSACTYTWCYLFVKLLENEIWKFGRNLPLATFGSESGNIFI